MFNHANVVQDALMQVMVVAYEMSSFGLKRRIRSC